MKRLLAFLFCTALVLSVAVLPRVVAAEELPSPVAAQITATSVRLNARSGYEYSNNGNNWTTINTFGGLKPETEYSFYQRRKGQPDTQSQPLVIKTPAKTPCTTPVVSPILDYATTDTIALVELGDIDLVEYEYRINGGSWQSIGVFNNLKPDTEYVLEQRVRSIQHELPSEPSEPLVVKTHKKGTSSYTNFAKVLDFIDTFGTDAEDGYKVIAYAFDDEYGSEYIVGLGKNGNNIDLELFYDGTQELGMAFDVQLSLSQKSWIFEPSFQVILVDGNTIVDQVDATALVYSKEYNTNYVFPVYQNGNYLTKNDASELATVGLQMLIGFWDEVFYSELGFGFKGLAFTAYEGLGNDFCAPQSGHHLGTYEEYYQRDPNCGIYGRTASTFCTICGEHAQIGKYISPKTEHTYDRNCASNCSTCGLGVFVMHIYKYSCSSSCSNCGLERAPLADHQLLASGLCTVCGTSIRLLGDISADGKINMGDISKLYSHVKGAKIITDAVTLEACDVNGDGKVNMGDISRLYSHVKGTNPLP